MGIEEGSGLYSVLGGLLILGLMVFFGRGLKQRLKEDAEAPKDWQGLIFPLVFVLAIVFFVISMLR